MPVGLLLGLELGSRGRGDIDFRYVSTLGPVGRRRPEEGQNGTPRSEGFFGLRLMVLSVIGIL